MLVKIFSTTEPSIKRLSPATFKLVNDIKTLKGKTWDCVPLGIRGFKIVILSVEEITKKIQITILSRNKLWIYYIMQYRLWKGYHSPISTNPGEGRRDPISKGSSCLLEIVGTPKSYQDTVLWAWLDSFPPLRHQFWYNIFFPLSFVGLNTVPVNLMGLNNLGCNKTVFFNSSPGGYHQHPPSLFMWKSSPGHKQANRESLITRALRKLCAVDR